MCKHTNVAEVFPPGEFLREELAARGWTQQDLAHVLDRPVQTVNQIINGHKRITAETAVALAVALGTSAELWLNLDNAWRLSRIDQPAAKLKAIARRAQRLTAEAGRVG